MSIVLLGKTTCSLCNVVLNEGDDYVGFGPCISDPTHRLWRYSDSTMHKSCLDGWEHAEEFLALDQKSKRESEWLRKNFETHQEAEQFLIDNPDWELPD